MRLSAARQGILQTKTTQQGSFSGKRLATRPGVMSFAAFATQQRRFPGESKTGRRPASADFL